MINTQRSVVSQITKCFEGNNYIIFLHPLNSNRTFKAHNFFSVVTPVPPHTSLRGWGFLGEPQILILLVVHGNATEILSLFVPANVKVTPAYPWMRPAPCRPWGLARCWSRCPPWYRPSQVATAPTRPLSSLLIQLLAQPNMAGTRRSLGQHRPPRCIVTVPTACCVSWEYHSISLSLSLLFWIVGGRG